MHLLKNDHVCQGALKHHSFTINIKRYKMIFNLQPSGTSPLMLKMYKRYSKFIKSMYICIHSTSKNVLLGSFDF